MPHLRRIQTAACRQLSGPADEPVPPGLLCRVERRPGGSDERIGILRVLGKGGNSDGDGDARQSGTELRLLERAPEVLGASRRAGTVGLRQQDGEGVAAETRQHVAPGKVGGQIGGAPAVEEKSAQATEQSISTGETQTRVDVAEAIDAGEDDRAASAVTPSALDLPAHAFLERGVIVETLEWVARRQPLQDGVLLLQLLKGRPVRPPQLEALDDPLQARAEVGQVERLHHEVGDAGLERFYRGRKRGVPTDDDNLRVQATFRHLVRHRKTAPIREVLVDDEQIVSVDGELLAPRGQGLGGGSQKTHSFQDFDDHGAHDLLVVHDESAQPLSHPLRHPLRLRGHACNDNFRAQRVLLVQSRGMRIGTRALLAPPVYLASRAQESSLADREVLGQADIDEFARGIPLDAAARIGAAVGPAHVSREGSPRVAVAVRTRGDLVLAVEFSLARLAPLVADSGLGVRRNAAVVDRSGRVVLGSNLQAVAARVSLADSPVVQAALAGNLGALSFTGVDHVERLGATAEVRDLGWVVAIDEPAADALAESRVLARRTAAAVAIALAAGGALALPASGPIVRPI